MENDQEEVNLVEMWLKKDPKRWVAGILAGMLAGLIMLGFSCLLALMAGMDLWIPLKMAAVPIFGGEALALGMSGKVVVAGLVIHFGMCGVLGFLYAHFTGTNNLVALLGVGVTWGLFSWIFIHNLFTPAFREVFASKLSAGAALFACLVFGVSLTSVAFFDRVLRGGSR